MKNRKSILKKMVPFMVPAVLILLAAGSTLVTKQKTTECAEGEAEKPVIENKNPHRGDDIYEKGYDLPIPNIVKQAAETDCIAAMERIQETYKSDEGHVINGVISKETAEKMFGILKKTGAPVTTGDRYENMGNHEKMEEFLMASGNGEAGKAVIYELSSGGGIFRRQFIFDGTRMFVLNTAARWNEQDEPLIFDISYTRIQEWEYTKKGWFSFEYCVPESPDVTEVVNGQVMIRVKPLEKEYIEIMEMFLLPIGYRGNNLLCSNWEEESMENIDYSGLFQYLYVVKHGIALEPDFASKGIARDEFESLIMEYLPVTSEQLRQLAVYDTNRKTYAWASLGCGNYSPNAFGSSIPEVTNIQKNDDDTVTLTIDAVCESIGLDTVMSHELTVLFTEDGGIRYLKNQVLGDGLERIPDYQYRVGK